MAAIAWLAGVAICVGQVGSAWGQAHQGCPCGNASATFVFGEAPLLGREAARGFVQPVRVIAPEGATIAFWNGTQFEKAGDSQATLRLQVGCVYRLMITGVPRHEGSEVFPSIELLDRLYVPTEKAMEFPVIVEIPTGDLDQAIAGKLVTRIVYLENPETAMPYRQTELEQPYFDVQPGDDPLQAAHRLGRVFAVVHAGSRIPDPDDLKNGMGLISVPEPHPVGEGFPWQNQREVNDEYIYDGGDRDGKTIVDADWRLHHLDPQDTIAHFDTLDGERLVAESNRVQIYSPRFAAVRRIAGAISANAVDAPSSARRDVANIETTQDQASTTTLQNIQPRRNFNFQGANALLHSTRGVTVDDVWAIKSMSRVLKSYEDFQIIRSGEMENAEKPRLGIRIDAAKSWDSDLHVQVAEGRVKPLVVRDTMVAQESVNDGRPKRPMIRLYKVASKGYAQPGEEVEFTIRFDNIGNEPIGNVTIVDNLTTRLEYIPDSAECSKAGDFKTERNQADSETLRWEITDPLEVTDGGIIRFRCRVR
jgi:uncharacterized repeat protein (TIGR01451 family)